jgi:uncharacterized protein
MPQIEGHRIAVLPRCEVKDVNYATGDVYFAGSVIVAGDVLPGFTVVATEDIEVRGGVERGTLRAGGKITVVGGISHGTRLEALGDVKVRFVEPESTIDSAGTIEVRESAVRSRLIARRIVVGHHLVAGTATASELISAGELGNEHEAETELEIASARTPSPQRAAEIAREKTKGQTELARLQRAIRGAGHDAAALKRLVPREVVLALKLLRLDHETLSPAPTGEAQAKVGAIVAGSKLYRGVHATIHGHMHAVIETGGRTTLRVDNGAIVDAR